MLEDAVAEVMSTVKRLSIFTVQLYVIRNWLKADETDRIITISKSKAKNAHHTTSSLWKLISSFYSNSLSTTKDKICWECSHIFHPNRINKFVNSDFIGWKILVQCVTKIFIGDIDDRVTSCNLFWSNYTLNRVTLNVQMYSLTIVTSVSIG